MSLLDKPQKRLNPWIFDEHERMHQELRLFIINQVYQILPKELVSDIILLGSNAGRQYSQTSDIDINIILKPGHERYDYKDLVKPHNNTYFRNSLNPIKYFINNYSNSQNYTKSNFGVYDVINNMWINEPKTYEEIIDPENKYVHELNYLRLLEKLNKLPSAEQAKKDRKFAYSFGWGYPRESFQNIVYKFLEKVKNIRIEDM